jgi:hypothetical protein
MANNGLGSTLNSRNRGFRIALLCCVNHLILRDSGRNGALGRIRCSRGFTLIELLGQPLPADLAEIGRGGMLDPWGNPYVYAPFPPGPGKPGGARKDKFLVPVNSTFDLYSMGPDGASSPPFTASQSHDDIVRANDGGFVGIARNF